MDLGTARAEAEALLRRHGLEDWRVVFDNARTRAGVCRPARREIGLSRALTALHGEGEVRDTILHEIAHALVGVAHGHDAVWRAKATEIGCSGLRCVPAGAARVEGPWRGVCPAGHVTTRHRRPVRVQACGTCSRSFDPLALISWTYRGRAVAMHPRYVAELAALGARLAAAPAGRSRWAGADSGRDPEGWGSWAEDRDDEPDEPDEPVGPGEGWAAGSGEAARSLTGAGQFVPRPRQTPLPVGARVRLGGGGRYAGVTGVVEKRGRTRYHVRTGDGGVLTAPFALVERI